MEINIVNFKSYQPIQIDNLLHIEFILENGTKFHCEFSERGKYLQISKVNNPGRDFTLKVGPKAGNMIWVE